MLRLNFARVLTSFLRNSSHLNLSKNSTHLPFKFVPMQTRTLLRTYAQYQFRTAKQPYYPDRRAEMKRQTESFKASTQLVVGQSGKHLAKDFYYKILGVGRHATTQQIRAAFYALAKRYHPDSTHSEQKLKHFQELSNAYNILTDDTKRLEYDQLGMVKDEQAFLEHVGKPKILQSQGPQQTFHQQKQQQQKQQELHQQQQQPNKLLGLNNESIQKQERDLIKLTSSEPELLLSFLEGTLGCKKRTDLNYLKKCEKCHGKSQLLANRDVGNELCRRCNGTGQIVKKTLTYTTVSTCTTCKGKRYVNRNNCETCDNRGFVLNVMQVLVPVPPGSRTGDVITIDNPNTKQRVNFHLVVEESDYFQRDGKDVHTIKFLNISDAVLGGVFKVSGLYEDLDLRVEPGTQSHTKVMLKNKGVRTSDGIGNHIITLIVRIPKMLTVKQRQLVLALAKAEDPVYERSANAMTAAAAVSRAQ